MRCGIGAGSSSRTALLLGAVVLCLLRPCWVLCIVATCVPRSLGSGTVARQPPGAAAPLAAAATPWLLASRSSGLRRHQRRLPRRAPCLRGRLRRLQVLGTVRTAGEPSRALGLGRRLCRQSPMGCARLCLLVDATCAADKCLRSCWCELRSLRCHDFHVRVRCGLLACVGVVFRGVL